MRKVFLFPIILTLAGCSDLARVAYYNTAYEALNPKLWNDNIVITGSKPKGVKILGKIGISSCDSYKNYRSYEFKAEDFGLSYKIKLPVINKDNDKCQMISVFRLDTNIDTDNYYIGWIRNIYNENGLLDKPEINQDNNAIINLNCVKKGVCYQGTINDVKDGKVKNVISKNNLDKLTNLTVNFGE